MKSDSLAELQAYARLAMLEDARRARKAERDAIEQMTCDVHGLSVEEALGLLAAAEVCGMSAEQMFAFLERIGTEP